MSLLMEIAAQADVPVEGVVRVLTREPVSDAVKARVLAVLDELDAEQTRVLQRFALAAVYDVLPRLPEAAAEPDAAAVVDAPVEPQLEHGPEPLAPLEDPAAADEVEADVEAATEAAAEAEAPEAEPETAQAESGAEPESEVEPESVPALPATPAAAPAPAQALDTAPLVQLGAVLGELADAVRELRRETDAERRERVDDLAVLIDLITKGWQGLDRRLGRLERQLGRIEPARSAAPPPERVEPPPPTPPPEPPSEPPPVARLPVGDDRLVRLRSRLPLVAALAAGIAIGAFVVLDRPSRSDVSDLVSSRDAATTVETTTGQTPRTTSVPRPQPPRRPSTPEQTSGVLGEAVSQPDPGPATTRRATPRPAPAPPATTATQATPKTTTAPPASGFRPTRSWAWGPVAGADYYLVQFFRDGSSFYRTRTRQARLTLPDSVVFRRGSYRWVVRPGSGNPADNNLRAPVVDSSFTVTG